MPKFRPLTDRFSASSQLEHDDFEAAKKDGYSLVINNRPDGEEPGQFESDAARAAAAEAGLAYIEIPMVPGEVTPDMVEQMGEALARADGRVLAYCKSGGRSTMIWALSQAARGEKTPDELAEAARQGGYDISPLKPQLEMFYAARKA